MRIKRIRRYRRARYPRGRYHRRRRSGLGAAAQGGLSSLLIMALTEACEDGGLGVTGPPPVMPELVTENEARQVIERVFLDHGVSLQRDFPLVFRWAQDSLAFDVDGYDPATKVGYEYVDPAGESPELSTEFRVALEAAGDADGPFIDVLGPTLKEGDYESLMEAEVLAFIEELKSMGII